MNPGVDYDKLVGATVADRYHLERLIGRGYMGAVYRAQDKLGRVFAVKIFGREVATQFPEYIRHLVSINEKLADIPGFVLPHDVGQTDSFSYEVYDYISEAQTLEFLIHAKSPFPPVLAVRILVKILHPLQFAHIRSIVHADLKPSNILVRNDSTTEDSQVHIIDFGMAQQRDLGGELILVGTYDYLPPSLKGHLSAEKTQLDILAGQPASPGNHFPIQKQAISKTRTEIFLRNKKTSCILAPPPKSSGDRVTIQKQALGSYIDVYSLGVITFRMLAGEQVRDIPASEHELTIHLTEKNGWFQILPNQIKQQFIKLVAAMLFVQPGEEITSSLYQQAKQLLADLERLPPLNIPSSTPTSDSVVAVPSHAEGGVEVVLRRLEAVASSLADATAVYIKRGNTPISLENSLADKELLSELDAVFESALKRNKKVWVLTIMMTVSSFALIFAMIASAVVIGLVKEKGSWSLIFGTASVPLIIGTLIWRPFDRMFRATILTHQLEMIHVQVVAAFRATRDPEQRRKICREGFDELTLLFDKHAEPDDRRQRTKTGPKRGRRQA